jgi:hypothetical protein
VDFIERILHIAPDGGSGLLEYAILVSLLLTAVGVLRFGGGVAQVTAFLRGLCKLGY